MSFNTKYISKGNKTVPVKVALRYTELAKIKLARPLTEFVEKLAGVAGLVTDRFLEFPDLSYRVERVELFAGKVPEPRGSFPSIHRYCPETFDTVGGEEVEPLELMAVITMEYIVPEVNPENTTYLLATPWSSDGVVEVPFKVYV